MAASKEGFQGIDITEAEDVVTEETLPYIYPSWHYRFHDVFSTYEPVLNKLDVLSKVYDATTIYKSRYFGYKADAALSRYWVAAQDKSYPLTTVLATGEPTVTADVYTMDKVYGFMTNQLFVEGYRAGDLDPSVRNLSSWPNFTPVNLLQMSRPFLQSAGGILPTLELDEAFPFVRFTASSQHAFTFTNAAASPVHTVQFRIPTLNAGIPTPILEYAVPSTATSSNTPLYVRASTGGNLEFSWGGNSQYTSPYIIVAGTWYSLYVALEATQVKFSMSPFDNPNPFDKQDIYDFGTPLTYLASMNATIGRNGTTHTSMDVYQVLAYMGVYASS